MGQFLLLAGLLIAALVVFHLRQPEMTDDQRRYVWRNLALMVTEIAIALYIAYLADRGVVRRWPNPVKLVAFVGMFFLIVRGVLRFNRVRKAVHEDDFDTSDETLVWVILGSVFGILMIYAYVTR